MALLPDTLKLIANVVCASAIPAMHWIFTRDLIMSNADLHGALATLYSELANGAVNDGGAFVLNSGDVGLLRSLDKLSAHDASHASQGGATIAAHAEHVRYGLSLMNAWARLGGNPFATADWAEAWNTSQVTDAEWNDIRRGLREESEAWLAHIGVPREMQRIELTGMIGSIVHLAYHLGALRQIARNARGPREQDRPAKTPPVDGPLP